MANQPSIADLMNQLGSMSYHAPSSYKGYQSSYTPSKFTPLNLTPYNFSQNDFKSLATPKSNGAGINLWDVLSGTLGQLGGVVTDTAYNTIKGIGNASKIWNSNKPTWQKVLDIATSDANPLQTVQDSIWSGLKNAGKEQWKDWTDGKATWGDIPLVGALHGMDKGWKRGTDIAKDEIGINNRWGQVGTGLALDVALDPLTYLTGGLSAASKLGKAAELAKTTELAKGLGLTGKFKNADHFLETATNAIKSDYVNRLPNVPEPTIDKIVGKKVGELADQIKTARNTTYNAHVNDWGLSVPFTNKFAKVGTYGSKNLLHNSEAIVPQQLVDNLLHDASAGDSNLKNLLNEAVKSRYGVEHNGQLTKTMYDDLHSLVSPVLDQIAKKGIPDVNVTQRVVEKVMPQELFTKVMDDFKNQNIKWKDVQGQLDQVLAQTAHDPALRSAYGSHLAQMVSKYWATKPAKNFSGVPNRAKAESMAWASKFLHSSDKTQQVETLLKDVHPHGNPVQNMAKVERTLNKQVGKMKDTTYNEMGDFKTNFEHALEKKNIFDPRTLATGDKFINSMGEHISDANTQRVGETARYSRSMDKIKSFIDGKKNMTDGEKQQMMEHAIYVLEKHAPDHLGGKDWVPSEDATKLANLIKPVIDRIGSEEQKAGILDKLRANYFPHVVNKDANIQDINDFMKRHDGLAGQSSKSKFNKERLSFQTLAERDNYIKKMEKAIQNETDSATIESLRQQQERVAKMYDTDVVSALQRRIKEGVRAKAMKDLQGKLGKYGIMKSFKKGVQYDTPTGLQKIEPDVAKKLGLSENSTHYIHPDVLKGMKRVDDIFTSEGMNKFVRHVSALADIWRPLVTFYKPSHYRNNIIGNVINNMAAGVKVSDYKVAGKLITGYRKGKLSESEMKIMEKAYKHNVISGGFLNDSHATYKFSDPTKLEKISKAVSDNKVVKNIRHHMGEKPDDISRLANFINGLHKFGNTEKAAKQVRTYLFNYNELTNADRTMRVLVPFWNWTKRNIPLQMKLLMENPKFAMNNERFRQLFNNNQEGADWQKETGIKVPFTNDWYTSVPSPTNDLNMVLDPRQLLGSMTPAAKIPLEMLLNKKMLTGKPISYGQNNIQASDIPQYLMSNLGIGGNVYDSFSGKRGAIESLINLFNPVSKINHVGGGGN